MHEDSGQQENEIIAQIKEPFRAFRKMESASGILLVIAAVIALIWANSPWANIYFHLWEVPISIQIGEEALSQSLLHWVNDGLMAIFFFQIGLEIKRELMEGELSSPRKAAFPAMAALGGMIIPVGLFFLIDPGNGSTDAWGVPMATDIAFSLGVLSLLGSRVPLGMKVFLSAFAIVDDIGAVLVIAIFYNHGFDLESFLVFCGLLATLAALNWVFSLKRNWPFIIIGLVAWGFLLESGIHATIAGVLVALTIPSSNKLHLRRIVRLIQRYRNRFLGKGANNDRTFMKEKEVDMLHTLKEDVRLTIPPVQRLEYTLHDFVSFFILPLFALANAGVALSGDNGIFSSSLTLSIGIALVAGKLIGITSFSWLAVKLGMADLPPATRWIHVVGLSLLGGIGFTMAIFISNLALDSSELLTQAKIGILLASLVAGIAGYLLLRLTLGTERPDGKVEE